MIDPCGLAENEFCIKVLLATKCTPNLEECQGKQMVINLGPIFINIYG
jgi:hypothetical protein